MTRDSQPSLTYTRPPVIFTTEIPFNYTKGTNMARDPRFPYKGGYGHEREYAQVGAGGDVMRAKNEEISRLSALVVELRAQVDRAEKGRSEAFASNVPGDYKAARSYEKSFASKELEGKPQVQSKSKAEHDAELEKQYLADDAKFEAAAKAAEKARAEEKAKADAKAAKAKK